MRFSTRRNGCVWRGLAAAVAAVALAGLLAGAVPSPADAQTPGGGYIGVEMKALDAADADAAGLDAPSGVKVVRPVPAGPADKAGLVRDDVILSVDGQETPGPDAFRSLISAKGPGATVKLRVVRDGRLRTIAVKLGAEPAGGVAKAAPPAPPKAPPPQAKPAPPKSSDVALHLMLETGGHAAKVTDVMFTPDGKQLVSASEDKTIRVWDLETASIVRTLRGEVEDGSAGKIYAMALSPDGRWLAAGGYTNKDCVGRCGEIRIHDLATGVLVTLLAGHRDVVHDLAFSRDGSMMISGSHDALAIVWEAPKVGDSYDWGKGRLKQKLAGSAKEIFAVGFLPDGKRALTGSFDGAVRVWDVATGQVTGRLMGHQGRARALSIAPDGTVASGDDTGKIRIWSKDMVARATGGVDVTDGRLLDQQGYVGRLTFSPDGKKLLSTCGFSGCNYTQTVWDVATGKIAATFKSHDNIVLASDFSRDGKWIATAGGDSFPVRLWSPVTGEPRQMAGGKPMVLGGVGRTVWAAALSEDGKWFGWGNKWKSLPGGNNHPSDAGSPVEIALRLPTVDRGLGDPVKVVTAGQGVPVADGLAAPTQWRRAARKLGNLSLMHRVGGSYGFHALLDVKDGETVTSTIERSSSDGYRHLSYSIGADGRTIISGAGNGTVSAYGIDGKHLGNFVGHTGDVWAVTPSEDGRLLVSGSADQTVRLWNLQTRELVVTLFHGADGEWVMWTPQGFYTGSPGGGRMVGWHLNNGADKEAEYVTGAQYRTILNRRDIVERAIVLASSSAAVAELAPGFDLGEILKARPPELSITDPQPDHEVFDGRLVMTAVVKSAIGLERFDVLVNGAKVPVELREVDMRAQPPVAGQTVWRLEVPLYGKEGGREANEVLVQAIGRTGLASEPHKIRVYQRGEGILDKRETLHILAIGVDKYPGLGKSCGPQRNRSCDLAYAGADAKLFARVVQKEIGRVHKSVSARVLVNGGDPKDEPTRANILAAMAEVAKAGPRDTVAVLIAGHGETAKDGRYYFLPTDITDRTMSDAGGGTNNLAWEAVQSELTKALGRRLLFVDACQSGAVNATRAYNSRLAEDARIESFAAFVATKPEQLAYERPEIGNGLFTFALARGLEGEALDRDEKAIRLYGLGGYMAKAVRSVTSGAQEPQFFSSPALGDLVLVRK